MEKPLIHSNGTSAEALYEGYAVASSKLRGAISALEETAPNQRDYYPFGDESFRAARREHESRLERLQHVLRELYALSEHVHESIDAIEKRKSARKAGR